LRDLYPFVLGPLAVAKLTFVQQRIVAISRRQPETQSASDVKPLMPKETQNAS
jgi:hypothetical protein